MGDDTEIKALREEALDVIMKLPKEKRIKMWNILCRFSSADRNKEPGCS